MEKKLEALRYINKLLQDQPDLAGQVEAIACSFQGKGWTGGSNLHELRCCVYLLGGRPLRTVIDVGGHRGNYSLEVKKLYPDARLFIFEPSHQNSEILLSTFSGDNKVKIFQCALSDKTETATLYSDAEGSPLSSLVKRDLTHHGLNFQIVNSVQTVRFDLLYTTVLSRTSQPLIIDLFKIDAEGHELQILEGIGSAIHNIKCIQFEFGEGNIDSRTYYKDFFEFFNDKHWTIHRITPYGIQKLPVYRDSDNTFRYSNFIALNNKIQAEF